MYQAVRATITLPQMGHQVCRRDATKACSSSSPPRGLRRSTSAARTHAVAARSSTPSKWGDGRKCLQPAFGLVCSTSCNKTPWGTRDHVLWICGIFRQNPFDSEEYESCKEAELTVCKSDHDGLGLLRGFSGIREQLFAGTRKGRWARSGQATRGQVKPWAGSGQTTWKRAPDVIRSSFNDWSYLSYEMPRETS